MGDIKGGNKTGDIGEKEEIKDKNGRYIEGGKR